MRRWAFNLAAAVSLLLFAGTVAVWVRSAQAEDYVQLYHPWTVNGCVGGTSRHLWSAHGTVGMNTVFCVDRGAYRFDRLRRDTLPAGSFVPWGGFLATRYGIGFDRNSNRFLIPGLRRRVWELAVRDWVLVLLTAALPATRLVIWYRSHAIQGACRQCGYDLRATPDRCPECGTPVATPAARTSGSV